MADPLLASATNYSGVQTRPWNAPTVSPSGDDVLLVALVGLANPLRTITPPVDWTSRVEVSDTGRYDHRLGLFDRSVATGSPPYADAFDADGTCYWGIVQLAFRTTGAQPTNTGANHANFDPDVGSTAPTLSATLSGTPTTGNVLVAGYAVDTTGGPYTGTQEIIWPAGWTDLGVTSGVSGFGRMAAAYRVSTGDETGITGVYYDSTHVGEHLLVIAEYAIESDVEAEPVPPEAGTFIDWDVDGFENGAYDKVSGTPQNVVSWTITRGASAEITGGAQPGSATVTVKNPDDIYNARNAASPLFGLLRDGPPIWIGVNSDGKLTGDDPRGLFGGRITDITLVPSGGAAVSPLAEITCEDFLSWAQRLPVQLDYDEGRAHDALRRAVLDAAGETRYDLDNEIHTMPLSHADGPLASVLDEINGVNGTRHLAKPENSASDWFTYTTYNRQHGLAGTSAASLDAASEHVTDTSGWRLSADTVTNRQKASVTPIVFTPGTFTVWQADALPFTLTDRSPRSFIVDFDDVVRDAVLDIASTGDTVTAVLTPFATAAKIELSVASGDTATVTALSVEGRLARRLEQQTAQADDIASQAAPRGIREGSEIGNEYLGVLASAQGIASHVVWRYGNPQLRPSLTVVNWFPEMFELDLYEVISFTSSQLGMSAVLFEIVGLTHEGLIAADDVQLHTVTYVLQESRVQAPYDWFYLDSGPNSSVLDGDFHLAY